MKIIGLIPLEKRDKCRCHFCDETRSVKYITEIFDPVIDNEPTKVCCCNKCILIGGNVNGKGDIYLPRT